MFCAGTRDSRVASYWIDPLVLKNRGNTYATLLHHPLLFGEIQHSAQEVAVYDIAPCMYAVIQIWLGYIGDQALVHDWVCYLLSTALDFPEEERMVQQSSVSISLSF